MISVDRDSVYSAANLLEGLGNNGGDIGQAVRWTIRSSFTNEPGLQGLAASHFNVLTGGTGSAEEILHQFDEFVAWLATGTKSMNDAFERQDFVNEIVFAGQPARESTGAEHFPERPEGEFESFEFASPVSSGSGDYDQLLQMWSQADDGSIEAAAEAWRRFGQDLQDNADRIAAARNELLSNSEGEAIDAAAASYASVMETAQSFSENAQVMAQSIAQLPHIRQAAMSRVGEIKRAADAAIMAAATPFEAEAIRRQARALTQAFMTGPYQEMLDGAVPAIRNLAEKPTTGAGGGDLSAQQPQSIADMPGYNSRVAPMAAGAASAASGASAQLSGDAAPAVSGLGTAPSAAAGAMTGNATSPNTVGYLGNLNTGKAGAGQAGMLYGGNPSGGPLGNRNSGQSGPSIDVSQPAGFVVPGSRTSLGGSGERGGYGGAIDGGIPRAGGVRSNPGSSRTGSLSESWPIGTVDSYDRGMSPRGGGVGGTGGLGGASGTGGGENAGSRSRFSAPGGGSGSGVPESGHGTRRGMGGMGGMTGAGSPFGDAENRSVGSHAPEHRSGVSLHESGGSGAGRLGNGTGAAGAQSLGAERAERAERGGMMPVGHGGKHPNQQGKHGGSGGTMHTLTSEYESAFNLNQLRGELDLATPTTITKALRNA